MIAYLNGTVLKKLAKSIIINTGNVGYLVHVTTPLLEKTSANDKIELFIYTKVREDEISLFGFEKSEQLEFFQLLLNVNGIGPKIGLEILSCDIDKTKAALLSNDIAYLSKVPGIGKKTAERMIVELKNKVTWEGTLRSHTNLEITTDNEALEALIRLGYQKFEIIQMLKKIPENITKTEEIITYFLKNI